MDALKSLVQPLVGGTASSSMIDGMKLVVLGGTVETARRVSSSAWSHFVNSFFLTAHFSEEDFPYDWLMLWLSRRPEWQRSREFDTTTRTSTPGYNLSRSDDNSFGDEDLADVNTADEDVPGKVKTRVVFQPTFETTHTIYYRGHWLRVKRGYKTDGSGTEMLSISVVARNNSILKQLVLQAKKEYEAEAVHRIQIYFADSHGGWRWTDSRHKRPMSSIVLNPGVKEMLLNDAKDFLKSEKWYADRGIPFRRGYLLHGVPGSGKSSLISAIAGELMLDIYAISLSSSWMNDSTLQTLMGRVPARCILLLEDLDAAFTRSVTRDHNSTGTPNGDGEDNQKKDQRPRRKKDKDNLSDVNTLSLSGLLNSLDGVAASEGRLLFATTNHLERLDPALSRPGRMDVWIEFRNASKWQAEALFRNFFPSVSPEEEAAVNGDDIILDPGELEGIEIPTEPPVPFRPDSPSSANSSFWPSPSTSSLSLSSSSASSEKTRPRARVVAPGDFGAKNAAYLPPPVEDHIADARHSAKPLDPVTLARLAKEFADGIPEEVFSVASLQGYLLKNKSQPEAAAKGAAEWVATELAMQAKLKKEREERQQKLKEEREQKKKEAAEKEKEKSELEKKEIELSVMRTLLQQANPSAEAELKKKIEEEQAAKDEEKKKKEEEEKQNGEKKNEEEEESEEEDEDENSPPKRSKWE